MQKRNQLLMSAHVYCESLNILSIRVFRSASCSSWTLMDSNVTMNHSAKYIMIVQGKAHYLFPSNSNPSKFSHMLPLSIKRTLSRDVWKEFSVKAQQISTTISTNIKRSRCFCSEMMWLFKPSEGLKIPEWVSGRRNLGTYVIKHVYLMITVPKGK